MVRRLVGEAFFLAIAREYLAGHPPRKRSLALFGAEFPGFLAEFPPADSVPYLADVARLERARLEALHAADAAVLAPAALARLGPTLAEARFAAHPAARIVRSDFPIVDIWRANQADAAPGPRSLAADGQSALITRPSALVELHGLSPVEAAFAESLLAGEGVSTAMARAGGVDESFDVTAAFRRLLAAGAFEHLHLPADRREQPTDRS